MTIPAWRLAAILCASLPAAATAGTPRTVEIPLYHLIDNEGNHRLGIFATLGGSSEMKIYELDTGSTGLYAADNRAWWPQARFIRKAPAPQSYGSGVSFEADIVETSVDFGGGAKADRVHVGRIARATGENLTPAQWNALVRQDKPPLHGVFFGNMGSGLEEKNLMYAVLAQLPGNLSTGFVVETRGLVLHQKSGPPLRQGRILVGLTDEIRTEFDIRIPLRPLSRSGFPVSLPDGLPAREEYPISVTATLSAPGLKTVRLETVPGVLDTGAPVTTIYKKKRSKSLDAYLATDGLVRPGTEFTATTAGSPGWQWIFDTGKRKSIDRITLAKKSKTEINLGIAPFFQYAVMYDIERGELGLRRLPLRPRIEVDGGDHRSTFSSFARLHGRATSPSGIVSIQYRANGAKRLRKANGTAQWEIHAPLRPGYNWLHVKATNRDGRSTRKKVEIFRRQNGLGKRAAVRGTIL